MLNCYISTGGENDLPRHPIWMLLQPLWTALDIQMKWNNYHTKLLPLLFWHLNLTGHIHNSQKFIDFNAFKINLLFHFTVTIVSPQIPGESVLFSYFFMQFYYSIVFCDHLEKALNDMKGCRLHFLAQSQMFDSNNFQSPLHLWEENHLGNAPLFGDEQKVDENSFPRRLLVLQFGCQSRWR